MNLFRFSIEQILSRNRLGLEMALKNELYGGIVCPELYGGQTKGKGTVDRFSFRFYAVSAGKSVLEYGTVLLWGL